MWLSTLAIVCALVGLAAGPATAAERLPERFDRPIAPDGPDPALFQEAVLRLVNAERARVGRAPLAGDARLRALAADQADAMARAREMSHRLDVPKPRLTDRLAARGVRYRVAAENIAMDKVYRLIGRPIAAGATGCVFSFADTGETVPPHSHASLAASVVTRWMASSGHRANILEASFRRMGAGAAIDPAGPACGDVYLAQAFAG